LPLIVSFRGQPIAAGRDRPQAFQPRRGLPDGSRRSVTPAAPAATTLALDYHLKPLREADLIRQKVETDGKIVFEWSNLFRRLPKTTIKSILGDSK
jgi:hypothetical protein